VTLSDFPEIVVLDMVFHDHQHPGNRRVPVCLCARELRSGKVHRIWLDGCAPINNPLPSGALYIAYSASAEWGCFLALGWELPRHVVDLFFEFRCLTNGIKKEVGDSLIDALTFYGAHAPTVTYKQDMRERILAGPPYSGLEREAILDYCFGDVEQTIRLFEIMRPHLRLPSAIERGRFSCAAARIEDHGIPIDLDLLRELQACWHDFREHLIEKVEGEHGYGVYQRLRRGFSFSYARFELLLAQEGLQEVWERTDSLRPLLEDEYLKQMAETYPRFRPFRELRKTLASLPSLDPPVGEDGRNRTSLMAFRAKTSRCQPKTREFVMGFPAWLRSLMLAEPGHALINIDLSSAEFGIVAALSQDPAMMADYRAPDPYIAFGTRMKYLPPDATRQTHPVERNRLKRACLGILYGMGSETLAGYLSVNRADADRLIGMHRRAYPKYWEFVAANLETAAFRRKLWTMLDWRLNDAHVQKRNALVNFPAQATGAEILRLACCLATEEGLEVVAPFHDALMVHVLIDKVDEAIAHVQSCWNRASAALLGGFELRCAIDRDKVTHEFPKRYQDGRQTEFFGAALKFLNGRGWVDHLAQSPSAVA
jgi:DNA polymerase I